MKKRTELEEGNRIYREMDITSDALKFVPKTVVKH